MKHILLMCFVWFALSPCIIKDVLLGEAGVEYSRPLNKSKTPSPSGACHYQQHRLIQVSAGQQSWRLVRTESAISDHPGYPNVIRSDHHYTHVSTGSSPPKYILYKRLKLGAV